MIQHGSNPVRWWVIDGAAPPAIAVPPADDSVWEARYASDCEVGKRTTRKPVPGVAEVLDRLRAGAAEWSGRLGYAVEDDPTLHGGGLHVTAPGGSLGIHLDYDRHPLLAGRRRALNVIQFLHPEWRARWGGELVLCDPLGGEITRIEPNPGRIVAFEVNDLAYHGVEPVTGPVERVTAAVYFLSDATAANTRMRAMFLPARPAS